MNKEKITRAFYKAGFKIKKHSPEILVGLGVAGGITSAVMACKATTKLSTILEEDKANIAKLNEYVEENGYTEKYTEEDARKDKFIMQVKAGVKVAKLYAPSVILGTVSVGSILMSHKIISKRNAGLAAAYATVDRSFKDYRGRVIERFGEALDKELKYDIKSKEVEEIVVNEKGKEKIVKKQVDVITTPNGPSEYARFFDAGNTGWSDNPLDPEANLIFLRQQQEYANIKLQKQGYLFLNDVYEMLGIPKTKAGFIVGWMYEDGEESDSYVDFGIYNSHKETNRDFVNGIEKVILLDFNVDGNILDRM